MSTLLKLLVIDASDDDARRTVRALQHGGYEVIWERVDTTTALVDALQRQAWDIITCEWQMAHGHPVTALAILKDHGVDAPIIVVSSQVDDELGVTAMRAGAHDFVSKHGLARLCPAVERELRAADVRRAARQVEQELRLGSEIATQLSEGVFLIKTSDQRIVFANPRFEQMFGYGPGELIGKHVSIVNAPTDRDPEETAGEIAAALATGKRWQGEVCNRKKDGAHFWCYASVSTFDHADFGPVWVAVHKDITDRKRAEAAVRESEERYRSLVTATAQVVWTTNAQGEVVDDCPSWRAFTGQTEQEILGRGWMTALHPTDRVRTDSRWVDAVGHGRAYETEYRVRRHDGAYRDFAVRGVPVMAKDGSIREWVGTCADITDLKRAREQLHAHQAEIAHVLRVNTMGAMAAQLAHEINQPLAAIANYAQGCRNRIASGLMPPEELLPAANEIAAQALRAGEIIRRLRRLVQKQTTAYEETDLNAVVNNAVHVLAPQAQQRGIPIRVELARQLPPIQVDQIQIEQVIVNLMLNAIEAMQSGDPLCAELLVQTAYRGDGAIELSVQDRGIGLTPPVSERMFEPFYTNKPSGLGMGLSISRSIVELHGGHIWGRNNTDRGATFHITLPLVDQNRTGTRAPHP
jgi:two-component system, LuxR family, sensor kinase FixL